MILTLGTSLILVMSYFSIYLRKQDSSLVEKGKVTHHSSNYTSPSFKTEVQVQAQIQVSMRGQV